MVIFGCILSNRIVVTKGGCEATYGFKKNVKKFVLLNYCLIET